jgi:hypothetical protein
MEGKQMNKFEKCSRGLTWLMALSLIALAAGCGGGQDPILGAGLTPDTTRPTVELTVPAAGAAGVAPNTAITATFSENMAPATITGASFTLTGPGTTAVAGTVTYTAATRMATFTPTTPATLAANTLFTATITTAATDMSGNQLAGNQAALPAASNYVWTFTTGADTIPPTVTFVSPTSLATAVCLQKIVNATFSEAMDPATINSSPAGTLLTFTLRNTTAGINVPGTVAMSAANTVATFTATSDLAASSDFTATITTFAKDTAGNALANNKVWSFTTGTQACSTPVVAPSILATAARFGIFGGTAGMTNKGIQTVITGSDGNTADIGTTATDTSAITGFQDSALDVYTVVPGVNQGIVTGKIYSCTTSTTGPTNPTNGVNAASCALATQARLDAGTAYLALAAMPVSGPAAAANLAGLTLAPAVYKAPSGSFLIEGGDLILDAQGDANAVWVFQMATTLTVGGPGAAAPQSVKLINGALAKNVFWQVGSAAIINAGGGGTMVGTIISQAGSAFSTAGNVAPVALNGRALSLGASVTLVNTVITVPAP